MDAELPDIDVVIIGVNTELSLFDCIQSVLDSDYPAQKLHIVYVDGGSQDRSLQVSRCFTDVESLSLELEHPTPGIGRNTGWRRGHSDLVLFLDADTTLDPDWLKQAVKSLQPGISAIFGRREERFPNKTIFNWIVSLEWNGPEGNREAFGGDVLIRRSVLELTQGYDEVLIGGEDPELSQRVRRLGGQIFCLDIPMTIHDINMLTCRQYIQRAYRTGYGYAAVAFRHIGIQSGYFFKEFQRIIIRGGGFFTLLGFGLVLTCLVHPAWFVLCLFALPLLLYPRLFSLSKLAQEKVLTRSQARKYTWHCSFIVLPQFFGVLRYMYAGMYNAPLQNTFRQMPSK
jgi:cellulose synthase/poly-beta-1,6-N-acetylglucosamine synthase-like glycosyltransferase